MIKLTPDYQAQCLSTLETHGFAPKEAEEAFVDVHKIILLRLGQLIEKNMSNADKAALLDKEEKLTHEEFVQFTMNVNEVAKAGVPREQAEALVNEVWDSYFAAMK